MIRKKILKSQDATEYQPGFQLYWDNVQVMFSEEESPIFLEFESAIVNVQSTSQQQFVQIEMPRETAGALGLISMTSEPNTAPPAQAANPSESSEAWMITQEQAKLQPLEYKQKHQLLDFDQLDQIRLPSYVIAFFHYAATGEGMTKGVFITRAYSVDELHKQILEAFGEFHAQYCWIRSGIKLLPGYESLIPSGVRESLQHIENRYKAPMSFSYLSVVHKNYG